MTICVNCRRCLFGEVVGGTMVLNDAGKMVDRWWNELRTKFPNVALDEYVIMPTDDGNHDPDDPGENGIATTWS